jgi:hypothetical protein
MRRSARPRRSRAKKVADIIRRDGPKGDDERNQPRVKKRMRGQLNVCKSWLSGKNMSNTIATLLIRNLHEVFGENDTARRRAAIKDLFNGDGVFYDPKGRAFRGHDEIDRIAGEIKATHPDFQYQPIAEPEIVGDGGRVQWVAGRPGDPPVYAGTDFIIARDGKISAVYLFFDKLSTPAP